jgi:2-keto-4-pentenoate hydratase
MPILDEVTAETLAERLWTAERERRAVPPISTDHPGMDVRDAYRVQQAVVRRRLAAGATIVGWKLGLTSRAMQDQLGVDQPDYGPILSDFMVLEGTPIAVAELIQPRVEAEIAFVLRSPLRGPGVGADDVLAATAGIRPAIEIIDSRIEAWRISLADTISDLASSARVTVGSSLLPIDAVDVRLIGCVLERGDEVVATGAGAAALGSPAAAVAWAANTLGELGITLEPGQLIMTGALHASVPVRSGDRFTARFDRLGTVDVRFR